MAARARIKTTPTPRPVVRAPAPAPVVEPGPGTWKVAAALFLLLFAIYLLNFRQRGAGDSIPTRRLPFSLLREGNLNLDEFTWERNLRGDLPYYVHYHDGHIYSVSTVATALVVTPLYVLPAWWLSHRGLAYDDVPARVLEVVMERIAAAIITALSAAAALPHVVPSDHAALGDRADAHLRARHQHVVDLESGAVGARARPAHVGDPLPSF